MTVVHYECNVDVIIDFSDDEFRLKLYRFKTLFLTTFDVNRKIYLRIHKGPTHLILRCINRTFDFASVEF